MEILRHVSGIVGTNQYLISSDDGHWVIDAPDDNRWFIEDVKKKTEKLSGILLTHGHFDHTSGLTALLEAFPGTPVYLRAEDRYMLTGGNREFLSYMGINPRSLPEAEGVPFLDYPETIGPFRVLHTPGHTMGSICLYAEKDSILFSGDTIFLGGEGRTDLGGSYRALLSSLHALFTLPGETKVLTGHGEDTTIALERNERA